MPHPQLHSTLSGSWDMSSAALYKAGFATCYFFFQAEDGIRDRTVTGVQTCALPILVERARLERIHRGRDRAVPGHQDAGDVAIDLLAAAQERDAVDFRHLQIGQQQIERLLAERFRSEERRVGKEWRSRRWAYH